MGKHTRYCKLMEVTLKLFFFSKQYHSLMKADVFRSVILSKVSKAIINVFSL